MTTATALLLVLAGCGRDDREAGAPGAGIGDTSAAAADAGATPMDPDQAEDRIEEALRADSGLAAFRLDADDENGGIELEGGVATDAQKTRAAEIAASMAPGLAVDNQIRVDASARREAADDAADEAEERVEDAFDADAAFDDLDVDDEDGRLVLEGKVPSAAERTRAEGMAKGAAGSVRLESRIEVEQP
jgi:osmotically-inducible protein OsmY